MTFASMNSQLHDLIDQLIADARYEERLQLAIDTYPELKLAKKLRSAQVQTRRSRKALIHHIRQS